MRQTRQVDDTFVGRDHELAELARIRERAAGGRRQLVVVAGEPGIGKTWLCEHDTAAAERAGATVVWGRCWPHGGAPALWPWPGVLTELLGPDGSRLLAEDGGRQGIDPERFTRFAAVARLLAPVCVRQLTVIVLDDVHRADESALLLTRFLAHALDRVPLVLVLARRDAPASAGPAADALLDELGREATTLRPRRFDRTDVAALLAACGVDGGDTTVVSSLLAVTGGSPLHLSRAVVRGGADSAGDTVEQAVADALARLPAEVQHILELAVMLGVDATVAEIAGLADVDPPVVVAALADAARVGLIEAGSVSAAVVCHDVVRQVVLSGLGAARLLDEHARVAALLAGIGRPERVAHHALAAAARSTADADRAILACREAAAALRRGFGYEQAATLLGQAVALVEHRPEAPGRTELLIERAEAVLACGRLTEARAAFDAAAEAAEQTRDPVLLARAVLGLGGVWVHEHRDPVVRQRVLARQQAALVKLPARERSLRVRLAVRLAAEAVYEGAPVAEVLDALTQARALGDDRALAESLSLTHNALLAPEHVSTRALLAEQQIAAASRAGDGLLALFGLLWRTVDRYLLGDPEADRSLAELHQRADVLEVAAVGYTVAGMDVMRLIRAGRLDEAEAAAGRCRQRGLEVGDANAEAHYVAQLLTIRWFQGRDAELAELVCEAATAPELVRHEYGLRASMAVVLARAGRRAEAGAALQAVVDLGLDTPPQSSNWLATMLAVVEAARLLDEPAVAAQAAELLASFAELPVMVSLGVSCLGSVACVLGVASLTVGDPTSAVAHFERAVADNRRWTHRPAAAVCQAELAEALLLRARPGDLSRARELLADATTEARALGLTARAAAWASRAAALAPSTAPALRRRRGRDGWTVEVDQVRIELPDLVGLGYLSELLTHPGEDLAAVDLCDAVAVGSQQEILDRTAVEAYRRRLRELDTVVDTAEADADLAAAEQLRCERDTVRAELSRSLGLGGRVRVFTAGPERARTAVRKAIKRAVDAIGEADPALGEELRTGISTGTSCRYTPAAAAPHRWKVDRL